LSYLLQRLVSTYRSNSAMLNTTGLRGHAKMRSLTLALTLFTLPAGAQITTSAWLSQGEAQQQAGELDLAENSYRQAQSLDFASLSAVTHLATVLQQEHQAGAAIHFWQRALELAPADPDVKFSLATALLNSGDNLRAAGLYRELLAATTVTQANRGDILIDLGTALARLTEYDKASRTYQQALAFPAVADTARLALIKALVTLLRYSDAQSYARQYLAAHPAGYEALYFAAVVDRGLGHTTEAQREFTSAIQADAHQFEAQLALGTLLRQQGQVSAAIPYLQQAVRLQPDATSAHFQLARAYAATGQQALARQQDMLLQQEEEQATLQTQITVLGNQAAEAIDHHDPTQAASIYRHIVQLDPRNTKALYDLAMLLLSQGTTREARDILTQAQRLDPTMPEVNAELGYLDLLAGHQKTAQAELERALDADPQSTEALGNLGVLYAQLGESNKAIHLLRLAVDHDPSYEQGHLNLGLILAVSGRYNQAAQELEQAVRLSPANANAISALAEVRQKVNALSRSLSGTPLAEH
jgi:protein O-GlcNAc transferase